MARGLEWAGMGRKEATRTCAFAAEEVEEGCNPDRERAKDRLGRETGGCAIHRDFAQKGVYSSYTPVSPYAEGIEAQRGPASADRDHNCVHMVANAVASMQAISAMPLPSVSTRRPVRRAIGIPAAKVRTALALCTRPRRC